MKSLLTLSISALMAISANAQSTDHSVERNTSNNQAKLTMSDGSEKYYNTAEISSIDFDNKSGKVTVLPKSNEWTDEFESTVSNVSFSKKLTADAIDVFEAKGWLETTYAKWYLKDGASGYNVYIKGGDYSDFTKIDDELVRNYGSYGRADMVGLKAGTYSMKVVPLVDGSVQETMAGVADGLVVKNYDRSGFAHLNNSGVGAYNDDGSLKSDARVIYVSASTAKTVSLPVYTGKKDETFTGLQAIVNAYQKGKETRPLDIRIIGKIAADDMDYFGSSAEGLQIKGKSNATQMNITMEGIGDDATIHGFGILLRNAVNVELRNFAIMMCMDDCVSIDTNNKYCWLHHLDLFYGQTGSDSDQAKGDGTLDVKGNSQYITFSYNHLFDSGKSSLCGMKSEKGPNYIDYHHNWFDHSDSRHPRVRTMSVHVWNNYYDGCSKYGVGATTGSSVFVENNYFRATKNPMLISLQGTDAKGDGTFSKENGGMIKSFGNAYAEKGSSSNYTPITHNDNATSFDCYEASSRDEQVPSSYVTLKGSTTYDNFDTDSSLMYSYTPDDAADVPSVVTGYWGAGRLNKGDFSWTFTSSDDTDYGVNKELKAAINSYTSQLSEW